MAMHVACQKGNVDVIKALCAHGASAEVISHVSHMT